MKPSLPLAAAMALLPQILAAETPAQKFKAEAAKLCPAELDDAAIKALRTIAQQKQIPLLCETYDIKGFKSPGDCDKYAWVEKAADSGPCIARTNGAAWMSTDEWGLLRKVCEAKKIHQQKSEADMLPKCKAHSDAVTGFLNGRNCSVDFKSECSQVKADALVPASDPNSELAKCYAETTKACASAESAPKDLCQTAQKKAETDRQISEARSREANDRANALAMASFRKQAAGEAAAEKAAAQAAERAEAIAQAQEARKCQSTCENASKCTRFQLLNPQEREVCLSHQEQIATEASNCNCRP